MLLRLAARNLARAPRRTAIALAAGAGGLCAAVVIANLARGLYDQAVGDAVRAGPGHLAVHRSGYLPLREPALSFTAGELPARIAADPGVAAVLPRLLLPALASSGNRTRAVAVVGVDAAREGAVNPFARRIAAGSFLAAAAPDGAVLAAGLAQALGVGVGDDLRLVAGAADAADGAQRETALRVAGILDPGLDELDAALLYVGLPRAQELGGAPGLVHELAVVLRSADPASLRAARATLGGIVAAAPGLALARWEEALPALRDAIALDALGHRVLLLAVYAVVGIGVAAASVAAALERRREHGLLLALGAPPSLLARLLLGEALLLGLASAATGTLLGAAATLFLAAHGLDARPLLREEVAYGGALFSLRLRASWDWAETARAAAALVAVHLAAALPVALRAARVRPAEAMRPR